MASRGSEAKLALLRPEQARQNMRLLLLANPNYFGTLKGSLLKPVLDIASDTNYEEIGCVGFSLALSRLEAVVSIKQSSGYEGGLCTPGSQEYVRFYLSFDGGTTWQDQGVAGFTAHDLPGAKPLEYVVTLPISPSEYFCFIENLPQVRAILSWNYVPPTATPDFPPVWGNVVDATIQIPSSDFIVLGDLLEQAKVKLPAKLSAAVDLTQSVATTPPTHLSVAELATLYQGKPVPAHRYLYSAVSSLVSNQASSASSSPAAAAIAKHPLATLNIDLGEIIGSILATSGDTSYEQLDCVGLDPNCSTLTGVVQVKLPYGFDGGLCSAGSTEYVAFWVDWGSGFEYIGTTTINTHDISDIPSGGLEYAAVLPIDLSSHLQPCTSGPQIVRVRGILSWQTPPPSTNPDYPPVWGNQLDALVQIPAGEPVATGTANIAIIGGIGVGSIDATSGTTLPGALFALTGTSADQWVSSRQCPFGGQIVIQGLSSVGYKYRVWVQQEGLTGATMLTEPVIVTDGLGNSSHNSPSPAGFFTYLNNTQNVDNILAYWESSGDAQWHVWLEIANSSEVVIGSPTFHYLIQLDNTAPTVEIHIDSGGDCKQFVPGTTIDGHFVAQDIHFGYYSLETLPSTITPPPNEPNPSSGTSQTAAAPGDAWSLNTAPPPPTLKAMIPCGYVVDLQAWDNAIVGSSPNSHNYSTAQVGFCLVQDS
jgi:hypothetical protein